MAIDSTLYMDIDPFIGIGRKISISSTINLPLITFCASYIGAREWSNEDTYLLTIIVNITLTLAI